MLLQIYHGCCQIINKFGFFEFNCSLCIFGLVIISFFGTLFWDIIVLPALQVILSIIKTNDFGE